jgi:hypothetical protein
MVTATSERSLLTYDGAYQVSESATLDSTLGGTPSILALPPAADPVTVTVDSDGSVLVARPEGDGHAVYDCQLGGACDEVARLDGADTDISFLGVGAGR